MANPYTLTKTLFSALFLTGKGLKMKKKFLTGVVALAAGAGHTCALLTGGGIDCWGSNNIGQLGTGDMKNREIPTAVTGLATGEGHAMPC